MGEERAIKIVEHLEEDELRAIQAAVDGLGTIDARMLEQVYSDFATSFRAGVTSMRGSGVYLQDLVRKARGEEEALRLLESPGPLPNAEDDRPLAALAGTDPDLLGLALARENPQVTAAVLAHLPPEVGATTMRALATEQQMDVIRRMASLEAIPATALTDVEHSIGGLAVPSGEMGEVDGVTAAAGILNQLATENAQDLLERLAEAEPQRAADLRRAMFTFENLLEADTKGLQQLLREIPSETLLVALKTASDALKEKLLSCMSSRAAGMMLEELEVMAPVRVSQVEAAQQEIVETAMRLVGEGKLAVRGHGDEMV